MERGIPKDSLLQASITIDNLRIRHDAGHFQARVFEDLARHALNTLVHSAKVTKAVGDYSTEYRLQVYCISPDDLHRIVQEEAMQLGLLRPVQCVPDVNAELRKAMEWLVEAAAEYDLPDDVRAALEAAGVKVAP